MTDVVKKFYDDNAQREWERGIRHRTEFAVTLRAIDEYFPPAPASIADIGGGPGRYAIELARRGYRVTLSDLSGEELALAEQTAQQVKVHLERVVQCNALDLSPLGEETYDAILFLGPVYHLHSYAERLQAMLQAADRLRPGGVVFTAFISRYAAFRDCAARYPDDGPKNPETYRQLWEDGINRAKDGFTDAYFAFPEEIEPLLKAAGLTPMITLNSEGISAGHENMLNEVHGDEWNWWVDWNYRFSKDLHLRGAADHWLAVAHK